MIYDNQRNDYCYKKTISKNKDVLAAAKEVKNATRPLKMEIENVVSVTKFSIIITIHMFLSAILFLAIRCKISRNLGTISSKNRKN